MFIRIFGHRTYFGTLSSIRNVCGHFNVKCPMLVNDMMLSGEQPAYIEAAILACNQVGE